MTFVTERTWADDAPTEWGIEVFTQGECWMLAYWLNQLGGWPVFVIAPVREPGWWDHAFVKVDGRPFDVTGFDGPMTKTTPGERHFYVGEEFTSLDRYTQQIADCEPGMLLHVVTDVEVASDLGRDMAKKLIEKHGL